MTEKQLTEAKELKKEIEFIDNVLREINKMRVKTSQCFLTDYSLKVKIPDKFKDVFFTLLDSHYTKIAKSLNEKFNAL